MSNIIVAFPKKEVAANIRNILVRGGVQVYGVCTTGAQVLNSTDTLDDGIVVCGYRMQDMMYTELRDCLPETFDLLLIASPDKWNEGLAKGVVGLPIPIKVYDILNTVQMMQQTMQRRCRKRREAAKNRSPEQKAPFNEPESYDGGRSTSVFAEEQYGQRDKYAGDGTDGIGNYE